MALSMFTIIPMPKLNWDKANMKYLLAALPIVGIIVGAILILWSFICEKLRLGIVIRAAGFTLLPLILTGGIHFDGYCDTVDALASHATPEKKRVILHDSNAGAFAVIWYGAYLLAYFAFCTEVTNVAILGVFAIISRAAGAFASLVFPSSNAGNLMDTFRDPAGKSAALICAAWFLVASAFAIWLCGVITIAPVMIVLLCALYVRLMSIRQFGGMSGDLAGFLIQISEISGLIAYIICEKAVAII